MEYVSELPSGSLPLRTNGSEVSIGVVNVRGFAIGDWLVIISCRMLSSATQVVEPPLTSVRALKRTNRPLFGVKLTSFSTMVLANVPLATGLPQATPSRLT